MSKAKPVVVDLVEDGEEKQDVIVLLEKDDKNNVEQPVNEEEEDLDLDGVQFDFIEVRRSTNVYGFIWTRGNSETLGLRPARPREGGGLRFAPDQRAAERRLRRR